MTGRQWFTLHSWAGFAFAGLLLLICVTGVLATVSYEIQFVADEKYRALEAREGPVAWAALEQNLMAQYPDSHLLGGRVHLQRYLAGEVGLMTPEGYRFVYFDPASGVILGEGGWGQVSRFLRNLHMYLSYGRIGKYIVTSTSLLLLISLVSSFYVYRKWWRGFWLWPGKWRWSKRIDWSSWHKWLGLWSWWLIAIMTLTGLWYLAERIMHDLDVDMYPSAPSVQHSVMQQAQRALPLATLIAKAQQVRPELDITSFFYPHGHHQAMAFNGQDGSLLVRDRANRVYLDPLTGEVAGVQTARDLPVLARIVDTADPLHFGNFSGLGVKIIYFVFGSMLTLLVAGGMRMHYVRTQRRDPNLAKWLGVSGSLAIIVSIAAIAYTVRTFDVYSSTSTSLSPALGSIQISVESEPS